MVVVQVRSKCLFMLARVIIQVSYSRITPTWLFIIWAITANWSYNRSGWAMIHQNGYMAPMYGLGKFLLLVDGIKLNHIKEMKKKNVVRLLCALLQLIYQGSRRIIVTFISGVQYSAKRHLLLITLKTFRGSYTRVFWVSIHFVILFLREPQFQLVLTTFSPSLLISCYLPSVPGEWYF